MKRNLDEKDIFNKFKKLGWSNDSQSKTIFNFLMKVHKQVKSNQILLDLGAGECRYSFFFDNCYYISVDFAKGDRSWNFRICADDYRADGKIRIKPRTRRKNSARDDRASPRGSGDSRPAARQNRDRDRESGSPRPPATPNDCRPPPR